MESITQRSPGAPRGKASPMKPPLSPPQRTLLRALPEALFRLLCGSPRSTAKTESAATAGNTHSNREATLENRFLFSISDFLQFSILHVRKPGTGLTANFRQSAPEIHVGLVSPRRESVRSASSPLSGKRRRLRRVRRWPFLDSRSRRAPRGPRANRSRLRAAA